VFAVAGWLISIIPEKKVNRREIMRRELNVISEQRKVRIGLMRFELGAQCNVDRARELTKLLAMDGRNVEAYSFGMDYLWRCGDDEVVDNWAHAPKPPRH
jgi:hypothetical protein